MIVVNEPESSRYPHVMYMHVDQEYTCKSDNLAIHVGSLAIISHKYVGIGCALFCTAPQKSSLCLDIAAQRRLGR